MFRIASRPRRIPSAQTLLQYRHCSTKAPAPKMPSRAPTLRSLVRATTSGLRPTTTQIPRSFSQLQTPRQSRSPSPPPPYSARNISIAASTTEWTRFSTPYTLSSVRTFASSKPRFFPNADRAGATTWPEGGNPIEEAIEGLQEMYGTARDEFEIAAEETEKNTTYAADDRAAARQELDELLDYYNRVIEGDDRAVAEEVKRRVGGRIRELEQAVIALEESVKHGD
ncbi:hypothetical protein K458DRAFT_398134 [Lentithecium fluviatile CBS 122367]|uniref:Uncharacterized protein n=1 Tax=Lentithecium fluviatile CBS 122367 TaxID=1168545 RepID=A0A6G1JN93_9PLEO|nr:hypothetical protein K458DRAFT_398134 [Lentithecium fluviatile CBS 122367]